MTLQKPWVSDLNKREQQPPNVYILFIPAIQCAMMMESYLCLHEIHADKAKAEYALDKHAQWIFSHFR